MNATPTLVRWLALAAIGLVVSGLHAGADEVKGKWRVEVHLGATEPGDSIESDTFNVQTVQTPSGQRVSTFDPRDRNLSDARLESKAYVEMRAGYGLSSWKNGELVLDVGIGQFVTQIEDIEFSYKWDRGPITDPFTTELINAGEITVTPVSVGLFARYRPTKRFNPYFGVNMGYMFTEYRESPEWKEVADALDASIVSYIEREPGGDLGERRFEPDPRNTIEYYTTQLRFSERFGQALVLDLYDFVPPEEDSNGNGIPDCQENGIPTGACIKLFGHDVERPRVDAPDTFYVELRGGAEWQWRPKVAFFSEMRFSWAADNIEVTADGRQKFGEGIGDGTFTLENAPAPFGARPAYISFGGIEGSTGGPAAPQPGQYFLQGGTLDYGGFTFTAGVRLTL